MAQVKKLSVGKLFGTIKVADLLTTENGLIVSRGPVHLARFGGVATGIKEGASDFGPWKALVGDFVGYSAKDGSEQRAPYLFLPDVALVPLTVALAQPSANGVRFMIDIFAVHNEESSTKYVYTWEPVIKPQGQDPVAELLALAAPFAVKGKDGVESKVGGLLALDAPKGDEAPKDETSKGKGKK